jgi:hypothetical protein
MDNSSIIPYLFGATFVIALGVGIYQYFRAKQAKRNHEHSVDGAPR